MTVRMEPGMRMATRLHIWRDNLRIECGLKTPGKKIAPIMGLLFPYISKVCLERETRFELATSTLARLRSTN